MDREPERCRDGGPTSPLPAALGPVTPSTRLKGRSLGRTFGRRRGINARREDRRTSGPGVAVTVAVLLPIPVPARCRFSARADVIGGFVASPPRRPTRRAGRADDGDVAPPVRAILVERRLPRRQDPQVPLRGGVRPRGLTRQGRVLGPSLGLRELLFRVVAAHLAELRRDACVTGHDRVGGAAGDRLVGRPPDVGEDAPARGLDFLDHAHRESHHRIAAEIDADHPLLDLVRPHRHRGPVGEINDVVGPRRNRRGRSRRRRRERGCADSHGNLRTGGLKCKGSLLPRPPGGNRAFRAPAGGNAAAARTCARGAPPVDSRPCVDSTLLCVRRPRRRPRGRTRRAAAAPSAPAGDPASFEIAVAPVAVARGGAAKVSLRLVPAAGIKINRYPKIKLSIAEQPGLVGAAEGSSARTSLRLPTRWTRTISRRSTR